jgi:hypothetical protein
MRGRPPGSKNKELPGPPDLLVIPRRIKKEITILSEASGVSPAQVLVDILDGGLINAREMYRTLIEYRKSLREQLDEPESVERPTTGSGDSEEDGAQRNGHAAMGLDGQTLVHEFGDIQGASNGLDLAPVGPGLGTESDETLGSDSGVHGD